MEAQGSGGWSWGLAGAGTMSVHLFGLVRTLHTPRHTGPFPVLPAYHPPPGCRRKCPRSAGSCHLLCCPQHRKPACQQEGQDSSIPTAWQPEPNTSSDLLARVPWGHTREGCAQGSRPRMPPRRGGRLEGTLHWGLLEEVPGETGGRHPDPTPLFLQSLLPLWPAAPFLSWE